MVIQEPSKRQLELFPSTISDSERSRVSATTHGRITVIGVRRKEIDLDKLTYALLHILERENRHAKRKPKRKRAA